MKKVVVLLAIICLTTSMPGIAPKCHGQEATSNSADLNSTPTSIQYGQQPEVRTLQERLLKADVYFYVSDDSSNGAVSWNITPKTSAVISSMFANLRITNKSTGNLVVNVNITSLKGTRRFHAPAGHSFMAQFAGTITFSNGDKEPFDNMVLNWIAS